MTALVKVQPAAIQQGGQGIDFSNPLFNIKPATLSINQRMTEAEGAIPGKLRIIETGDQFDEMTVTLLQLPVKERQYQPGTFEQRKAAGSSATMCFSRDCVTPDAKAKVPQAMKCDGCPRADWKPWQQHKEKTGTPDPNLIPPCQTQYPLYLLDTVYKLPLRMYVRGGSIQGLEDGMGEVARKFMLLQSQGLNPNIFDLSFKIKVAKGKKGTNYILAIDNKSIKLISEEDKAAFGQIYLNFVNRGRKSEEELAQEEADEQIGQTSSSIDSALNGEYVYSTEGDITV